MRRALILTVLFVCSAFLDLSPLQAAPTPPNPDSANLKAMIDAPILFTKRHSYQGIHIYDTYYQWWPGGGIYILQNPSAPKDRQKITTVIDSTTQKTLGDGVYSDPELSWDAKKLLFSFKGSPKGNTDIYEINIDGTGLIKLTDSTVCLQSPGREDSHHNVGPAYLPDGRIIFTSTKPNGLVPCNNTAVDILHVMNADGSDMHTISVNNVNEFDPSILPDGRILYGRWEYVDKTALTQQTLWTIYPDGSNETAIFANNLVQPEAFLDARPVPGAGHLLAASLTKHNSTPRGSIGIIDTRISKNDPEAITSFDNPQDPTVDYGDSCEPFPLSPDVLLFSGRPKGAKRNRIEIISRDGIRQTILKDPDICLHSPILLKPSQRPPIIDQQINPDEKTGTFFVQDIYQGLTGVNRGDVKFLRVIEETSRASGSSDVGKNPYNQTFLLSAALAFSVKNFLGIVPVQPDGSAYFQVPSGRAIYLQALDADGKMIQSMRTFVQASPGVTRSCVGCHEHKYTTAKNRGNREILRAPPAKLKPESWGSGFVDYPSMVQPVLDKHCVKCHGGQNGIKAALDLTGGWTEHFSISYENLVNRKQTQVTADLIAGIDCMNGTARFSAQIFPPRSHGSGAAPLANILVSGHHGRIKNLTRPERDLILAWIDTNGLYHGSWDYTENGCRIAEWPKVKNQLVSEMRSAGCMSCHEKNGKSRFESDWINLKDPHLSRILRSPMKKGGPGLGLADCRKRKVSPTNQRIRMFYTGGYVHHVLPLENFKPKKPAPIDRSGDSVITFDSTQNKHYRNMLAIITSGKKAALASPRIDMPGAQIIPGLCRRIFPVPAPDQSPQLTVNTQQDGVVNLTWPRSADTIGLSFSLYRHSQPNFQPQRKHLVNTTTLFSHEDLKAPQGKQYYALVASSDGQYSKPTYTTTTVPKPTSPDAPTHVTATPLPSSVQINWTPSDAPNIKFNVYRQKPDSQKWLKLNPRPLTNNVFVDSTAEDNIQYRYSVRSINRHSMESMLTEPIDASPLPEQKTPILDISSIDEKTPGQIHGNAKITDNALNLSAGGYLTIPYSSDFDLTARLSVQCWVKLDNIDQMPVIVSCGQYNSTGWFLQKLGSSWRWHLGGTNCDGGSPKPNEWTHLAATFDESTATLYQNGTKVASVPCAPNTTPFNKPLHVGQYSAGPSSAYQVKGQIKALKIYRRALKPAEIERIYKSKHDNVLTMNL